MVHGIPIMKKMDQCEACVFGKQLRTPFPSGKSWRARQRLELIHTDLCGPMQVESLGRSRSFLVFIDDFSQMTWVYFLKNKS